MIKLLLSLTLLLSISINAEEYYVGGDLVEICGDQAILPYDECMDLYSDNKFTWIGPATVEFIAGWAGGKILDSVIERYRRGSENDRELIREMVRKNKDTVDAKIKLLQRERRHKRELQWRRLRDDAENNASAGTFL